MDANSFSVMPACMFQNIMVKLSAVFVHVASITPQLFFFMFAFSACCRRSVEGVYILWFMAFRACVAGCATREEILFGISYIMSLTGWK